MGFRCDGSTVKQCRLGEEGCLEWQVEEECRAPYESCVEDEGRAECVALCEDICGGQGDRSCSGNFVQECFLNNEGCLEWSIIIDCDDGLICNGTERCDPNEGCIEGSPPDCNDGIECTLDSCDETMGGCIHQPDDGLCDNGSVCDGTERCDTEEGCLPGESVVCDDDDPCTEDLCNEATGSCLSRPGSGLPCDLGGGPGSGRCLAGECVESGCGDGFVVPGVEECDSGPEGTVGCTSECRSVDFRLSDLEPEPDRNGEQLLFEVDHAVAALADGRFAAIWMRNINSGCGPPLWSESLCGKDIEARFFTDGGEPEGPVIVINPDPEGRQQMPVVAAFGEGFLAAWAGDDFTTGARDEVFVHAFDADGEPLGGAHQVNVRTYAFQDHPTLVSLPDGGAFVAWEGPDMDRDPGIFLRRINAAGRPEGEELLVSSPGRWVNDQPSLAVSSDGSTVLMAWETQEGGFDYPWIAALLIDSVTGEPLSDELALVEPVERVRRHSVTTTALPEGGFFVTWVRWDNGPTSLEGIFLNEDGDMGSPALVTPSSELADYDQPSVAAFPDGTLAVAWGHGYREPIDGRSRGIGGLLFELAGPEWLVEPLSEMVALNTSSRDDQTLPHLAASGSALALCFVDDDNEGEDRDPELVRCRVLPSGWISELP
jgi:hypothetical protein